MSDNRSVAAKDKTRHGTKYVWIACLLLLAVLLPLAWNPFLANLRQVQGLKGLLAAAEGLSSQDLQNPFVCLRPSGDSQTALQAVQMLSDPYLQAVGLCLAGEQAYGLTILDQVRGEKLAAVQYIASNDVLDGKEKVDALLALKLPDYELVPILGKVSALPDVDPLPSLRLLAAKAPGQPLTWYEWIWADERLVGEKQWQEALDLLEEGSRLAPGNVRSSLLVRIGKIQQIRYDAPDYQAALAAYDQAIEVGGWLMVSDEVAIHNYRGDIYRTLKDQYTAQQALAEYETALRFWPGYYWSLMNIGHLYFYNLQDYQKAEDYYRQALASDAALPNAYYYLGEVFRTRGDKIAAVEWYRQALSRQADFQAAIDRLSELEGK